ncbi:MAG: bifunctional prephenate dehydrogenase/3-phosphoshikimate 1-carboxyvinyltransferase [Pseudomonadales bacterium]
MLQEKARVNVHRVEQTLIIGLGMIGGSLAKALRESRFSRIVSAYDYHPESLSTGVYLGVIDRAYTDLAEAVAAADLIVLAVPVKATAAVLRAAKAHLREGCVITDVGSTKGSVIEAAREVFGEVPSHFVPGHPIAGSEKSGVAAANSKLFNNHKVIITPHEEADEAASLCVARMWQSCGAEVLQMPVEQHDEVLAATSHLPHLLAFSLVDTLARESQNVDIFRYAAGGFRDFTRIAASDPTMWSDVCGANKKAILAQIDTFTQGLAVLREAVECDDEQQIKGIFLRARAARERFGKMLAGTAYAPAADDVISCFQVQPSDALQGKIEMPGDKSISHRAVILAALADGVSQISGFLHSEDSLATVQAFRDMGVVIEGPHRGELKVYGVGKHGLCPPPGDIYLGNSGTSMRLLAGVLAAQPFDSVLTGDDSLSQRPMARVAEPLNQMGGCVETTSGCAPIRIQGSAPLVGIDYEMPVASAQVKSSLLLAGLCSDQGVSVTQPAATRDHTELLMESLGVELDVAENRVAIHSSTQLKGFNLAIPGDLSSAAFFIVGAAISPGSDIELCNIGINPTRLGLIEILRLMGANITLAKERQCGGEPVADIRVRYAPLQGVVIPQCHVSTAIDEFPALFVAASCANGETRLRGAAELRHKESDRIAVMVAGLTQLGINIEEKDDGVVIQGGSFKGALVDSAGDHRTAMAFAIAALRCQEQITVLNCAPVATSFPEFVETAAKAGLNIQKEETHVSNTK